MSQEERQMTPGEVLAEAGESLAGEGAVGNLPGPWDWQSVPYAPPFQTEGIAYPQLVQVPMSYFPGIAQRPEPNVISGDQVVSEDADRQYSWGNPYHHYPYHHYWYHYPPYYRTEAGGVTEGTDANTESNATASPTTGEETRQLFPFIGISPFGPSFGFGFGGYGPFYPGPFYPRPFYPSPFYPRPFYPHYPPNYYRPPYYW